MNTSSTRTIRYGTRFGCRFGQPHDMVQLHDGKTFKVEKCQICGMRKRWNKTKEGRIDNTEYLKYHVRQFAQPGGATKRVFMKLHEPEKCIIKV